MSWNATMNYELKILDRVYDGAAEEWAPRSMYRYRDKDGNLVLEASSGYAGRLETELHYLADEFRDELNVPVEAWECWIKYVDEDYPHEDGSTIEMTIRNGRIAEFKESRIEMVDAEPWVSFDMTKEG